MKTIIPLLLVGLVVGTPLVWAEVPGAVGVVLASATTTSEMAAKNCVPDSKQMEKDLQRLPWKQFRSVIESIPKLKSGIDAYGQLGWQFVQANYTTYSWKKNIDKLDETQKKRLAELIQGARGNTRGGYCDPKRSDRLATEMKKHSPEYA